MLASHWGATMSFEGKTVWITGASSGIGEALAQAFAQEGARLILSARRAAELERVRNVCANPDAHAILPLDLTDFASDDLVRQALDQTGQIDILVNNGGISQRSLVVDTDLEVDRRIMEVNYFGAVKLTKAVLPHMLARRSGHIVVVSSVVGKFSTPRRSAYAASKHALHGFFDALRAEVHNDGIRVTLACPGYVQTNLSLSALKGDGSTYDKMDRGQAGGLSAAEVATQILRGVAANKAEIYMGREATLIYLKRYWPGLFNFVMRRARRT